MLSAEEPKQIALDFLTQSGLLPADADIDNLGVSASGGFGIGTKDSPEMLLEYAFMQQSRDVHITSEFRGCREWAELNRAAPQTLLALYQKLKSIVWTR